MFVGFDGENSKQVILSFLLSDYWFKIHSTDIFNASVVVG